MTTLFLREHIKLLIIDAGISVTYNGFFYLETAIMLFSQKPYSYQSSLYEKVGQLHHKNFKSIGSAVDRAVAKAWKDQNSLMEQILNEYAAKTSITLPEGFTFIKAAVFWLEHHTAVQNEFSREWVKNHTTLIDCKYNLLSPYILGKVGASDMVFADNKYNILSPYALKEE